jgi:hypothetical protein
VHDGVANAYTCRISRLHGAPTQANGYLNIALKGPAARPLAIAFAAYILEIAR